MTLCADLNLALGSARPRAGRIAASDVDAPCDAAPLIQSGGQAFRRSIGRPSIESMFRGPFQMARGRTVARFAADVDRLPVGRESIGCGIVVLPNARRVAVGAHEVPVLRRPGPVQLILL